MGGTSPPTAIVRGAPGLLHCFALLAHVPQVLYNFRPVARLFKIGGVEFSRAGSGPSLVLNKNFHVYRY